MQANVAPALHLKHVQSTAGRRSTVVGPGSMVVTPDRIVYSGLLGAPSTRMLGAHTVYIADETPFEITLEGAPAVRAWLAMVPANRLHRIASSDRLMRDILIEPESASLTDFASRDGSVVESRTSAYLHMQRAYAEWLESRDLSNATAAEIDGFFFGTPLTPRTLDPRIQRVVAWIRKSPQEQISAAECARLTGLSFSRFVHLFKQEIGMTFRAFCAWKRARAVLPSMTGPCNLTHLALEAGYPDSTHFSHSMRRIFGLRPRDILSGSRRLSLHCPDSYAMAWMRGAAKPSQGIRSTAGLV
jgi:AraC-like DNA-binding protein